MKRRIALLVPLIAAAGVHAQSDELIRVEHCHTSRTTEARAECEKRRQDFERVYRREQQLKRLDAARKEKKGTLCFTRKATQETVCPNQAMP